MNSPEHIWLKSVCLVSKYSLKLHSFSYILFAYHAYDATFILNNTIPTCTCSSDTVFFFSLCLFYFFQPYSLFKTWGRDVAQAVIRWLPTAAAQVRVRAAYGVCGGQSATGAGFLRVLRFPLLIIPPISPSS
jgi:hypothetical protein